MYIAGVLLHELGHALPAAVLGFRVGRISVGRFGPPVLRIRLFGCTLELRLIPYGGLTRLWPRNARHVRAKFITCTLCGPLVTLTLALGSLAFAIASQSRGTLAPGSLIFAAVNGLLFLQVAIPRRLTIDSTRTASDFLLAWETWSLSDRETDDWVFCRHYMENAACQERADFAGAKQWLLQGLHERPNDPECLLQLGFVDYHLGNVAAARQTSLRWLELSPVDPLQRPYVWNLLAYCNLADEVNDLAAAERYSSEAVTAMPWIREFQETRQRVITAGRQRPASPA